MEPSGEVDIGGLVSQLQDRHTRENGIERGRELPVDKKTALIRAIGERRFDSPRVEAMTVMGLVFDSKGKPVDCATSPDDTKSHEAMFDSVLSVVNARLLEEELAGDQTDSSGVARLLDKLVQIAQVPGQNPYVIDRIVWYMQEGMVGQLPPWARIGRQWVLTKIEETRAKQGVVSKVERNAKPMNTLLPILEDSYFGQTLQRVAPEYYDSLVRVWTWYKAGGVLTNTEQLAGVDVANIVDRAERQQKGEHDTLQGIRDLVVCIHYLERVPNNVPVRLIQAVLATQALTDRLVEERGLYAKYVEKVTRARRSVENVFPDSNNLAPTIPLGTASNGKVFLYVDILGRGVDEQSEAGGHLYFNGMIEAYPLDFRSLEIKASEWDFVHEAFHAFKKSQGLDEKLVGRRDEEALAVLYCEYVREKQNFIPKHAKRASDDYQARADRLRSFIGKLGRDYEEVIRKVVELPPEEDFNYLRNLGREMDLNLDEYMGWRK